MKLGGDANNDEMGPGFSHCCILEYTHNICLISIGISEFGGFQSM